MDQNLKLYIQNVINTLNGLSEELLVQGADCHDIVEVIKGKKALIHILLQEEE